MGKAYTGLVERDRDVLLIQLQSQVASPAEPKIREGDAEVLPPALRARLEPRRQAGPEEMRVWFAHGMLCNVMAAIDAEQLPEPLGPGAGGE